MDNHFARQVVHFDLDTFFVSVERLLDKRLEKRPVIVGGNPHGGRGVVAGCSREAREFGVHSAQPIRMARRLCPDAVFLYGDNVHYTHYGEYSRLVGSIFREIVPLCEKSSVDEFYLDISRTESLKGDSYEWAKSIRKTVIGETHLPISLGIASNKLIAKVATTQVSKNTNDHHFQVQSGHERAFLSPFPIRALPGIGEIAEDKIKILGINTIGHLAQVHPNIMQRLFGKTGRTMNERANGIDISPVIETREQKSFSHQSTLEEDTINVDIIFSKLLSLSSKLASDLRENKFFTGRITLEVCYSDFKVVSKAVSCSYTNNDRDFYLHGKKLFIDASTRRVRVRRIGIKATDLIDDLSQQFLFIEEKEIKVYPVFDSLRTKYGRSIIGFAGAVSA